MVCRVEPATESTYPIRPTTNSAQTSCLHLRRDSSACHSNQQQPGGTNRPQTLGPHSDSASHPAVQQSNFTAVFWNSRWMLQLLPVTPRRFFTSATRDSGQNLVGQWLMSATLKFSSIVLYLVIHNKPITEVSRPHNCAPALALKQGGSLMVKILKNTVK